MKKTSYDFSPPPIIGVLGDFKMKASFARKFEREFLAQGHKVACLPFRVEKRYLKNVVECMKLIDVVGLIVHPSYSKTMIRHLPKAEKAAREAGFVDLVVHRDKGFVGMNAWTRTVLQVMDLQKNKSRKITSKEIDQIQNKICIELLLNH